MKTAIEIINKEIIGSTIRIFKAVPIFELKKQSLNESLLKKIIDKGFLLSPEVVYNYNKDIDFLIEEISEEFGLNGREMNATFHKQWSIVKNAEIEELIIHQLFHYITTYGFKSLDIYSDNTIYIPLEDLDVPDIQIDRFPFIIIKGYTKEELKQKVFNLLKSGIALSEDSVKDIANILKFIGFLEEDINQIKNKEVRILLYDYLEIIPQNPIEFLRFCIYKSTKTTLLIKNEDLFKKINENENQNYQIIILFSSYKDNYGFEHLAEIFNRFKPLFLAFRTNGDLKQYINKIRKLAKKYHKPMQPDYLNNVTDLIKKNRLDLEKLKSELKKVNTFRKIRLLYALKYRTIDSTAILYRIRNNKSYAKKFTFNEKEKLKEVIPIVLKSIIDEIKENISNKRFYIPNNIFYSLPSSEKSFVGTLPYGSYISIPNNMIVGIHWENIESEMIDLDLSLINTKTGKIGWDTAYRTEKKEILFSGDITSAPKPFGATELFYVQKNSQNDFIMFVNYYNFRSDIEVPFRIIIGKKDNVTEKFMLDPNQAIVSIKTKINNKQKILGFIVSLAKENRFYFVESILGNTNVSYESEYMRDSIIYLTDFFKNMINLNEIIVKAGGIIVDNIDESDIDLSIEKLEKDTIIKLFQ